MVTVMKWLALQIPTPMRWLFVLFVTFGAVNAQGSARILVDDFEDADLTSEIGWSWSVFAKHEAETISMYITEEAGQGSRLIASGKLPDFQDGFTYGGIVCGPIDRETAEPIDLSQFAAIGFRAASDRPGYYAIRVEQAGIGYNSTNVVIPVTDHMQQFFVPMDQFATGSSATTALTFTRLVDEPGAPFHLELDDLALYRENPSDSFNNNLGATAEWAPSPEIAWQNAKFENKPLLCYFSSEMALPCQEFENRLVEYPEFSKLAESFILTRLNVNQHRDVASRYDVWRVPSFLVFEPVSGRSAPLYEGSDVKELGKTMNQYLKERPEQHMVASQEPPSQRYNVVMVDDFSDRNQINMAGGTWNTFEMGDQGDILPRFLDLGGGNLALEIKGRYPGSPGAETYGGFYCELSRNRTISYDLSKYRWISWVCYSSTPSLYQIHLEDAAQQRGQSVQFQVGAQPSRITLPISYLGEQARNSATIVWTQPEPRGGQTFHLVIDDVMLIQ